MNITLQTSLAVLSPVGRTVASRLKNLNLKTVKDLIFYYPFRYEDYSHIVNIADIKLGEILTIKGRVEQITDSFSPIQKKPIVSVEIADETGRIKAVWFNQPFIAKNLRIGDYLSLSGKVELDRYGLQLKSPEYEKINFAGEQIHTGRLAPVYPLTAGITQKQIRFLVKRALAAVDQIEEWLPDTILFPLKHENIKTLKHKSISTLKQSDNRIKVLEQFNNKIIKQHTNSDKFRLGKETPLSFTQFINLIEALKNIHFPENLQKLEQAKYRLKFDELFLIQLRNFLTRKELKKYKAPIIKFQKEATKKFVQSLPFELTIAQRKTAWQILRDLEKEQPMNRLLEGDVGSGKTAVALIAMLNTVLNVYQAVLMAPTEILAHQHFETIVKLLAGWDIAIGLLTHSETLTINQKSKIKNQKYKSKTKKQEKQDKFQDSLKVSKKELISQIARGKIQIIIGTHALIQENIKFKNLALAIIDEQHRFGVEQRKSLREKTQAIKTAKKIINSTTTSPIKKNYQEQQSENQNRFSPHFLSMSATPIPRSLALTLYGDLDLSIINEMPKARKPIITKVVDPIHRNRAYEFIKTEIKKRRQIFVICPLIEESDVLGVKSATQEYERLRRSTFVDFRIGLLHGKLKNKEKQKTQKEFATGKIDILVATSVVEVGIDVPNASVMMIEGAERFGLAQLHQFRGRVGRSVYQSYCFLFTEIMSLKIRERLSLFVKAKDGFEVAELDLKFRGAGEIFGTRQHGLPEFKIADLSDHSLIELSQTLAREIIKDDPSLIKYPKIKEKIFTEGGLIHLE